LVGFLPAFWNFKALLQTPLVSFTLPQANYASWAGASIFGATDAISTRSFTREQYSKEKAVPDWSNLRFNNVYNDERQG
jgi:hypothetical protein